MTLPFERTYAVLRTREFLLSLLDPDKTPNIPTLLRQQARSLLKHYPNDFDMHQLTEKDRRDIFGSIKDPFRPG